MNNSHMKDFYDIFGVWHEPWWQTNIFRVFVLSIVVAIVMWLLIYLFRKLLSFKRVKPSWEIALTHLSKLRVPEVPETHNAKNFYVQLTCILKRYISERYGSSVQGCTDKEIISYLDAQVNFPKDILSVLYDIFSHAGNIKFANEPGVVERMEQDLALGLRLVKETIPLNK